MLVCLTESVYNSLNYQSAITVSLSINEIIGSELIKESYARKRNND